MPTILQTDILSSFTCLGDKCEDTCCKGWSMQVDEATLERYKREAPELLDAVEPAVETPWIMRKDPKSGYCVKFENGLCGIHKKYGDAFLGDACHFYPRSTRALGETKLMTATLSCPEISRLALFSDAPFALNEMQTERLPQTLKNYLPEGLSEEDALAVHRTFLSACEEEAPVEIVFARAASAARSLELVGKESWVRAAEFYLKNADARLPQPETNINDAFNVLHALCGLIVAVKKPMSERLRQTVSDMETALGVSLDWNNVLIHTSEKSVPALHALQAAWKKNGDAYENFLRRYLQMQFSLALFPFSGLGGNISERITIIGVRLATIKLALMTVCGMYGSAVPQEIVVRVVQSLSRFQDHLGDPAFSLQIYAETGWTREPRMRGLLGI